MNQTQDMMNVIHLGLDNGALALEEQRVAAATLKALTATERRIQGLLVEMLAPAWMRRQAADAFEIVRGGIEQMSDLDARDRTLAQELCGAHEALVARKERAARQGGSQTATEAVATRQG
jgi:phage terminase small subunit